MHYALKLLETQYRKQHNRKQDEYSCVSQLWQRAQQGTHLFPDRFVCLHTAEWSDDPKYPERLEVHFYGYYLNDADYLLRSS